MTNVGKVVDTLMRLLPLAEKSGNAECVVEIAKTLDRYFMNYPDCQNEDHT